MSTLDGPPETSMPDAAEPVPETPVRSAPPVPPGPPLDRVEPLNLSRRPFLNSRPVVRVSLLLLLLGLALLLWNVVQFQRYLEESADKRAQIEQGEREVARQQQVSAELQSRLADLDLTQRNERVEFLNEKIAERTFSWSLLLDRLTDALPNDVRLIRLTPRVNSREQQGGRRRTPEEAERRVPLGISAEARNNEALLRFVDNLFAHPAFAEPDLTRQEQVDEAGNVLRFEVDVQYIPGGSPQNVVIEEVPIVEEPPAPGTAPGDPEGDRP